MARTILHRALITLLLLLGGIDPLHALTINIPADLQTIQEGVNEADWGDTVLVQPGVYHEEVNLRGRTLTLASMFLITGDRSQIDSTIIDGEGQRRCLISRNHENRQSLICGFTLQNGIAPYGGGYYCFNSSPTVTDLVVRDCIAATAGGGIYITQDSEPRLTNIVAERDSAGLYGGGVGVYSGSTPEFDGLTIRNCGTGRHSGAFHISHAGPMTVSNFVFDGNRGPNSSGLAVVSSEISFMNGSITNNVDGREVLYSESATIGMFYLLISGNASTSASNFILFGAARLDHVTMVGNTNNDDATIYYQYAEDGVLGINNSIFWNNGPCVVQLDSVDDRVEIAFSDVEGGREAFQGDGVIAWDEGNLDSDPLFTDPNTGDYSLTENSPCIDAADPETPDDPDGSRADMGAFYYHQVMLPELVSPIPDVMVEEECGRIEIADLDTVFSDADDTLEFVMLGERRLGMTCNEDHILAFEPELNFNGENLSVEVRAHGGRSWVSDTFRITITPVNDPPEAFDLLRPEDGFGLACDDSLTFDWHLSVEPDQDPVFYRLSIALTWNRIPGPVREEFHYDAGLVDSISVPNELYDVPWPKVGYNLPEVEWWVEAISLEDTVRSLTTRRLDLNPGSVEAGNSLPKDFSITSVFPNPFNASISLGYTLPQAGPLVLAIYDSEGRLVETLRDMYQAAGDYRITWTAGTIPTGVYFARLEAGEVRLTTKLLLVR